MSDDITAALRGFADEQRLAAAATPPDLALESGTLARRVRRRRAVRTGSAVLTTVAVVGAVTVGSLLSGGRTPVQPAIPAPTSTPTTSPTSGAAALRGAQPMTPGMLDAAGDDWSLIGYSAMDDAQDVLGPQTAYLLSPDGQAFVVPADLDGWYLQDWLPHSSLVVAATAEGAVHVLDLVTGEVGPDLGFAAPIRPAYDVGVQFVGDGSSDVLVVEEGTSGARLSRVGADGEVRATTAPFFLLSHGSAVWLASPDRSRVVLNETTGPRAVTTDRLAPSALPAPYPDRPDACRAWMWVDDAEVLLECTPAGASTFSTSDASMEYWLVPVDGDDPRQLVGLPIPERLGGVWRVGDRLVAGSFGLTESASWWEVTDDGVVPLSAGGSPDLTVYAVRGSELLATLRPYAETAATASVQLVAIDPVGGTTRTVAEWEPAWYHGLTVAPSRFVGAPEILYADGEGA